MSSIEGFYPAALGILLKILDQPSSMEESLAPDTRREGDIEQLSGDTDQKQMSGEHTEQSLIVRMR